MIVFPIPPAARRRKSLQLITGTGSYGALVPDAESAAGAPPTAVGLIRAFPDLCQIAKPCLLAGRSLPAPLAAIAACRGASLMRLSATDLACRRGGREVFANIS